MLCSEFGVEYVFMDVVMIEFGVDFCWVIECNMVDCGVLLVLIGCDWFSLMDE